MPEVESGHDKTSPMYKLRIVEQIEYYFGDFNLFKDKFLKEEITKDHGWIPLTTLIRFNRLAALTKDVDVILSAFKEHPSNIVQVNVDRKTVRRNPDREVPHYDEIWRSSVAQKSVYIKGFPAETTTLDDLLKFMQTFGKIDNIYVRNYFDKTLKKWKPKGSAYVTFPSKDEVDKFLAIKSVKYAGNELIRKWQPEYIEEKKAERIQQKAKVKETKDQLIEEQRAEITKELKKLPTGALIRLCGLDSKISMNQLKHHLMDLYKWDVAFVDYGVGACEAYVRLQEENTAKEALEKLTDKSIEIGTVKITAELVEGEKEKELLEKMEADKNSKVLQNMMKGKKGKKNKGKKKGKQDRNEEMRQNAAIQSDKEDLSEQPSSSNAVKVKSEPNDTTDEQSSNSVTITSAPVSSETTNALSAKAVDVNSESMESDTTDAPSLKRKICEKNVDVTPTEAVKKPKSEPKD